MRYVALATDYDGTIAAHGRVDDATMAALRRATESGRRLILVTGRELDDLRTVFDDLGVFERVVAENGGLLHVPATGQVCPLAEAPPQKFVDELRRRGVSPLSVGRVIVATWEPNEAAVLEVIHGLGLEMQVIFNKGAVMVLPSGVNKATGLGAALAEMHLSFHNTVGVGDAENDHAFLSVCECSVAVSNALPSLRERVDVVMTADHGAGVQELVEHLLTDDLASIDARVARQHVRLGSGPDEEPLLLHAQRTNLLLAGPSGGGKSTLATAVIEQLTDRNYQICLIDPEGDHEGVEGALALGEAKRAPTVDEVLGALETSQSSVVVNLLGVPLGDRPDFTAALLPRLQELRMRLGRPHRVILDESHHLLPAERDAGAVALSAGGDGLMFITVHPDHMSAAALRDLDLVVAVGHNPATTLWQAASKGGTPPPPVAGPVGPDTAVAWRPSEGSQTLAFTPEIPRSKAARHRRKYAEGELPEHVSFYFRGPDGRLNLRAQNLNIFMQVGEGVDDETWLHHLRNGDIARWFRDQIKDPDLVAEAEALAENHAADAATSRERIRAAIETRYTGAA